MKKIMFNDRFGLTEAVLSGRKTQTRRICKHQRPDESYEVVFPAFSTDDYDEQGNCKSPLYGAFGWRNEVGDFTGWNIPKYKVGEIVAVAQSYESIFHSKHSPNDFLLDSSNMNPKYCGVAFHNKMFVRADLMPHHIRITGVKVERLQDISEEDCLKEGVRMIDSDPESPIYDVYFYENDEQVFMFGSSKDAYASLIDRISGKGTWESNPWVFAYEFELVD